MRSASGLLDALGLGYDLPVGQAVYAIDAFPDDDLLWRIEWIGGVGYNTSVPSEADPKGLLFRTAVGKSDAITRRPMRQADAYRMIRRRAKAAGIHTKIGNHTFPSDGDYRVSEEWRPSGDCSADRGT